MSNAFKNIEPQDQLPLDVKKDVLGQIETISLLVDFWDLFAQKRVALSQEAIVEVLNQVKKNQENPNKQ